MIWLLVATNILTLALLAWVARCSKHNQRRWIGHWEAARDKWHETYEAKVDAELEHRKTLKAANARTDTAKRRLELSRNIDPSRDAFWF